MMDDSKTIILCILYVLLGRYACSESRELCSLKSPDGSNEIAVYLNSQGMPSYRVQRNHTILIEDSPLGLRCDGQDFSRGLALSRINRDRLQRQTYSLLTGNCRLIDTTLSQKSLILKNAQGLKIAVDLVAGGEGVAFRYRFEGNESPRRIIDELTGFQVPSNAEAWLQPYHTAGRYTPAYEDFYFRVAPGKPPVESRAKVRGWCLPGLFQMPSSKIWMLIAESGADGSYCACHLDVDSSSKGLYKIALAFEDEVTGAKTFDLRSQPDPVLTYKTPWRVIIMADQAGAILNSTLITDLAEPCRIDDISWIQPGRASWSWWSHPDGPNTEDLYNQFTDLAAEFHWEYTLFDAGWWNVNLENICRYANNKCVKPLLWTHAADCTDPKTRRRKMDEWVSRGVQGIKVDFWCSDRQETMAAIDATLEDAAARKLVVILHGCTIPRGWHRTWPNLLTAEAVLGTESYFYESRYPGYAAQLNTILPFTRNVSAPMDITPFALTLRKYPRKTTAAHELAAALVFTSGIIHYADSVEVFTSLPEEVKRILRLAPAAWDETKCFVADPGRAVVLARRAGKAWFIAGLNGTAQSMPVRLDLKSLGTFQKGVEITEGRDLLMHFSTKQMVEFAEWQHQMPSMGGFVLELEQEE
ncbi:MAG: glycoside hydrolase family 97 catalytic domain-containing protein [Anaerohalosphaeraceae bacterium]